MPDDGPDLSHSTIAVIYPKAIGDLVFLLPALHGLRQTYPQARLLLVVKDKQAPLALPMQGSTVDDVIIMGRSNGPAAVRRQLFREGVDCRMDMAGNDQAGLLLAFAGGRRYRPHRSNCKGFCALYSPMADTFPVVPPGTHRVDELLSFARHAGVSVKSLSFRLYLPAQAVDECEKAITKYALRHGKVIALNIGASRATKRWPADSFRALAVSLVKAGFRAVIMGAHTFLSDGNYDRHALRECLAGIADGEGCVNLVTEGNLPPALQLQRDANFLRYSGVPLVTVGCDTGPMQIAGSVGEDAQRKTVSLFGPTNWRRYAPYDPSRNIAGIGRWNRVILAPGIRCAPQGNTEACDRYRRGCASPDCMRAIAPEMVLRAVVEHAAAAEGTTPPAPPSSARTAGTD